MDCFSDFVLQLYRLAQSTPVTEFQNLALEMLKAVVPFRTATWSQAELTTANLRIYGAHLHEEPPEMVSEFSSLNRQHRRAVLSAALRRGKSLTYYAPQVFSERSDGPMLSYVKRYGHEYTLMITDESATQWISCYRPKAGGHFIDRDGVLLDALMPHLVEALAINRSLALGEPAMAQPAAQRAARALMDRHGALLYCGNNFHELLRLQWPDWSDPRIPTPLLSRLKARGQANIAAGSVWITAQALGEAVLLTARQTSPLQRLSPRERAVAREFGGGKSYKAVAKQVRLAPATVRNMLQSAYRKLGIDNNAALARLLELEPH